MNKIKTFIYSILVFLFAFSFNSRVVKAYFTDSPEGKINNFTIAEIKELLYQYFFIDDTDAEVQAKNSVTTKEFAGIQLNIVDALADSDCENIKHYIDDVLYNSNTYTVVDDATIKEVCKLNRYNVVIKSYTIDKDDNKVLVNTDTKSLNKDRVVNLNTNHIDADYDEVKYYIGADELDSANHTVAGDVEIERDYHLKEYTITHKYSYIDENNQKHSLQSDEVGIYNKGDIITIGNNPLNVDYDHIGYLVNNSDYTENTYEVTGNATIEDVYYLNVYNITYNLDGGTLNNPKTSYTSMTETFNLPTPTRTYYNFNGWCVGSDCSNTYTVTKGSTGDIEVTADWEKIMYTVTHSGNNYTYNGPTEIGAGETIVATATGNFNLLYAINGVTVTMGGRTLNNNEFSYSNQQYTYTINIPNVTGNVNIDVSVGFNCVAEGTKVMLWDGSYKNVENITYNDLLKVWNHDTGTYGYEYPAWIEKAGSAGGYIKLTFSDGNELKVVGDHSIFSKTLNRYVNINSDELKVGDQVVNLKDGISYVTVTSKEIIEEEVKYYHVISSRYFNLITNDLLTTYEIYDNISNFMGFDKKMKWQIADIVREDLYIEEDFKELDSYLFKTFRLGELKYLVKNRMITIEEMNNLFDNYLMDSNKKVIPPRDKSGKYLWMVTTSDDENPSDKSHQLVEGSTYEVPMPVEQENFKYWYNHSDNKYYNPGDMIEVDSSMYLEAIYE